MDAATPLGSRGRSVISSAAFRCDTKDMMSAWAADKKNFCCTQIAWLKAAEDNLKFCRTTVLIKTTAATATKPADKCALIKCRAAFTCKDGKCVKPVLRCPAANCKVYFDGCNTCTCGADGTLKRCAKKNTCAGDTSGQAKCRKSYPAPKTTRAPFAGSTDITCRGRNPDPKDMGSMTHIGTLDGCKRQANELNMITTACGAKSGSFVCRTKATEVDNEFFVGFQGTIRECKARTKALTKGIAKFNLGTEGAQKVKFSCSGSDISVAFKRKTTLGCFRM